MPLLFHLRWASTRREPDVGGELPIVALVVFMRRSSKHEFDGHFARYRKRALADGQPAPRRAPGRSEKSRRHPFVARAVSWFNFCRLCQDLEEQMLLAAAPLADGHQLHAALLSSAIASGEGLLLEGASDDALRPLGSRLKPCAPRSNPFGSRHVRAMSHGTEPAAPSRCATGGFWCQGLSSSRPFCRAIRIGLRGTGRLASSWSG